ncbi:MAG: disulfide bond formation protein DsbA [Nocardioides sp.]|nr:disulfide bond formation protein DsbA [Nocardioides sp.]
MAKKNREVTRAERAAAAILEQRRRERLRQVWIIGGVVVAVLAIVVIGVLIQSNRDTTGTPLAATAVPAGVTDTYGVVIGDANAPTTVEVYEDFQCPICREFEQATRDKLRAAVAAGRIKIDYRMVSFLDSSSTTNYSSRALNAAAVVLDTSGKDVFLKFHDLLYENQPAEGSAGLSNDQLIQYAVQAGAKESAVRPGIEGDEFAQWVTNTQDEMSKNGVTGTPSVFVDGKYAGNDLQSGIDAALKAAG